MPTNGKAAHREVEVRVEYKPGVLDPEAASVERALRLLGVKGVVSVRCARTYVLRVRGSDGARARARAEEAVEKLLANPVIHRVEIRSTSRA
jgi:phosphoribosylformylglycinamidine synthase PurS subunit